MRNCYQCPECTAPLSLVTLEQADAHKQQQRRPSLAGPAKSTTAGPWALACAHCGWTTHEIGVEFDKPHGIAEQLNKPRNIHRLTTGPELTDVNQRAQTVSSGEAAETDGQILDEDSQFTRLQKFYASQLAKSTPSASAGDLHNIYRYGSPDALARLVGLYTGTGSASSSRDHIGQRGDMREASGVEEGVRVLDDGDDEKVIAKMKSTRWEESTSGEDILIFVRYEKMMC